MRKLILAIRDYSYLRWLRVSEDPEYAWRQQKQMVIGLLGGSWYFALLSTTAILLYKLGVKLPQPNNIIGVLIYGVILFIPYAAGMWWWLGTFDDIPVDHTISYKRLGFITWLTVTVGIVLATVIPPVLQAIIP